MRADREDIVSRRERRSGNYTIMLAIGGVLVVALLLYVGLRDGGAVTSVTPAPAQVVRDSAIVAPSVINTTTTAAPDPAPQTPANSDFPQRQLAPTSPTVGAGEAPVIARDSDNEALVIDGPLLEELEEDARAGGRAEN